jgi:bifunctional non-homologous end joining protein LigD
MNGVASEIAQKVFVLFENYDVYALLREQKGSHHSRRTAAGNTATSLYRLNHFIFSLETAIAFETAIAIPVKVAHAQGTAWELLQHIGVALEEYSRKRDFQKTAEPGPSPPRVREKNLAYAMQKHEATRLHYDFRLELDGVLLSWAVTKGPSLNPANKRLAVRVEDHPLAYGNFEGTIPHGEYGGGTVMLWDEGTWEPKDDPHRGLKKGHLSFVLHGQRLKGAWDLIRMRGGDKRENWLLVKENDAEADRTDDGDFLDASPVSVRSGRSMAEVAGLESPRKQPRAQHPVALPKLITQYPEVQLATLVDRPPQGDGWLHEIKFDGYRLLGYKADGEVRLRTRNGQDWTSRFPSLAASLKDLNVSDAVLDMEAVVLDDQGKSSFQALQAALGEGGKPRSIVAYVFDVLHLEGQDTTKTPLRQRKEILRKLLKPGKSVGALRYSDHVEGDGRETLAKACESGLEGIVSKESGAAYVPGRQMFWLKTKCSQRQELVILGFSDSRKGERSLGALYLGFHRGDELEYAGKVGTGFSMKSARSLVERLAKLSRKKAVLSQEQMKGMSVHEWRSIHWVKPELLCEVAFTEWTQDGRLRHPSFQGLRDDKDTGSVKKELPVASRKVSASEPAANSGSLVLHGIKITHPDRIISEAGRITKGDLAEYYAAVAPLILPHIARHPISLLRCPSGLDGECFYQRNPSRGLGPDVHAFEFNHDGKKYEYLDIEDEKGLMELVQMGAVEIHPWGSAIDAIDFPDRLIFDLDPAENVPFSAVKQAALDLRAHLRAHGLESELKCTGGKGLHVTVGLAAKDEWSRVKSFAHLMAQEMASHAPDSYVMTMSKKKRDGKIFVDYLRNDYTATAIADYSVRARAGAPVAVPLDWSEIKTLTSADAFTMKSVLERLARRRSDRRNRLRGFRLRDSRGRKYLLLTREINVQSQPAEVTMQVRKIKQTDASKKYREVLAASTLSGDTVRNSAGEDLGKVDEIMIDITTGRVAYAVVSFGGFLRMGNKLFAIPWSALTVDEDEKCFILDVDKSILQSAPGFDKDNWPDMANTTWGGEIYRHYGATPYWEDYSRQETLRSGGGA